jgi:hypothetical protein
MKTFRIQVRKPQSSTDLYYNEEAETMALAMGQAVVRNGFTNGDIVGCWEMNASWPGPGHQLILDLIHASKKAGSKIEMIKTMRNSTGLGLKEAKDLTELLLDAMKALPAQPYKSKSYVVFSTWEHGDYADYRRNTFDDRGAAMDLAERQIESGATQVVVAEVLAQSQARVVLVSAA